MRAAESAIVDVRVVARRASTAIIARTIVSPAAESLYLMKHQYFGDENDYRKYGLLRALTRNGELCLGVCWMLTPDDGRSDGRFISYLQNSSYRRHDPELFDALSRAMASGRRHLGHVESEQMLRGAHFFEEIFPDAAGPRDAVFRRALKALSGTNLIFFDPDNGLEVASKPRGRRDSSKFLFWAEVAATYKGGHSILIYQHFPREERTAYTQRLAAALAEETGASQVVSLSTSRVLFLLAGQGAHQAALSRGLEALARNWGDQFRLNAFSADDLPETVPLDSHSLPSLT